MFFHKQTKEVEQVEKFVRSLSITIPAKYEDEIYKLYPTDIYYIETIDRRTYLYTASRVYESSENLLYKLRSMMISKNSHIEAVLGNDEHIVVTRSYIAGIKEAFAR